jgi:putative sigma-54 modulation protein
MRINVQSIHFVADRKLVHFIQKKIGKLQALFNRMVRGDVFLRLNNEGVENKTVEIRLKLPGSELFAVEKARTFEAATAQATDALKSQLKKFKTRIKAGRV